MFVHLDFISGLMFGLEYLLDSNVLVIDVGIVRVYVGKLPNNGEQ